MSTEPNQATADLEGALLESVADEPAKAVESDFYDFVNEAAEPEEVSPKQSANASEEAGEAEAEEQTEGEAVKAAEEEAKPQEASDSQPEAAKEEAQEEAVSARRSFWDHYLSTEPIGDILDHLQKQSGSRYDEMTQEVAQRLTAEPDRFAKEHFKRDPDGYGRQALAYYDADKNFWREQVLRDNPDIREKVEGESFALTSELEEDLRYYFPDQADKLIEKLKAGESEEGAGRENGTASAVAKDRPVAAQKETQPKEAEKPQAEALPQEQVLKVLDAGYREVETYLETKANDPKELGLAVTKEERAHAPEVADLKDFKRLVLFDAYGDLPSFERGLYDYAKERELKGVKFMDAFREWKHFAEKGEEENTKGAARKMIPFADHYLAERLKHPLFSRLDRQIAAAIQAANPKQQLETVTPGREVRDSQARSLDPETAFFEEAANFQP
jgi:hypothetical protein